MFSSPIGIQDIWISCLKLGINLSHKNIPLTGLIKAEFFTKNLDLMHGLLTWRTHASGNESPSEVEHDLFSPLTTCIEICL